MAFRRLQEQILQHSHDMGLFAWIGQPSAYNSMLAEGPQCSFELSHQSPLSVGSFTALQLGPNLPFNSAPTMTTTSQNWNIPIKNYVKLGLKLWLIQVGICKWGSGAQLDIPTSAATSCPTSCLDSPALGLVVEIKNMRNFRPSLSPPPGPTKKLCKTKAWVQDRSAQCWHSSKTPTYTRYPVGQKPKLDWHSPWVPPQQCCLLNQAFFWFNSRCHQASLSKAHRKRW